MLVLPSRHAPSAKTRAAIGPSVAGRYSANGSMPADCGSPAACVDSLRVIGSPSSAPCPPDARAASAAAADSRARSAVRTVMAFSAPSSRSIRSRCRSTSSTELTSRASSAASMATAVLYGPINPWPWRLALTLAWLRLTAARTSVVNAASSIASPSRKSMARRVFPSRLELKRPAGSSSAAPLANVILTTCLYVSPVHSIPSCDHTGTPRHFHSSTTSGSACLTKARSRLSVSPLQSPSSSILASMSSRGGLVLRRRHRSDGTWCR